MSYKRLVYKGWTFRLFEISAEGHIRVSTEEEFEVPYMLRGKKTKLYMHAQLLYKREIRWLPIHRLVAWSWLGGPPHPLRYLVDHKDGNSQNNRVENLRWVTICGNNINRTVKGGTYFCPEMQMHYPRICRFIHKRYGFATADECRQFRKLLVNCYVNFTCRFPELGSDYPHFKIHRY